MPRPIRARTNVVTWNHSGGPAGPGLSSASAETASRWPDRASAGAAAAAVRTTPSGRRPDGVTAEVGVARAGTGPVRTAAFLACARARACAWARALDFELAIEL